LILFNILFNFFQVLEEEEEELKEVEADFLPGHLPAQRASLEQQAELGSSHIWR
jgi:hypothetical protein